MNLLPGEILLQQSNNNAFVLTSHRVRLEAQTTGLSKVTSIMLEELSACEITTVSKPWLLVAALVVFILGLVYGNSSREPTGIIGGIVVAVLLVAAYFGSRQGVISLRSSGGAINASTTGLTLEASKSFIDAVEAAKNARYFAVPRAAAAP